MIHSKQALYREDWFAVCHSSSGAPGASSWIMTNKADGAERPSTGCAREAFASGDDQPVAHGDGADEPLMSGTAAKKDMFALVGDRLLAIVAGCGAESAALGQTMTYAILAPGKSFRGRLLLLAAEGSGGVSDAIIDAACAIEMVHCASLILDDLPCMDNARTRRGRDATHVVHGESRAVLAGVALITEANRLLATARGAPPEMRVRLVSILCEALGPHGLCAGQEMDLHAEKTDGGVLREQDLKTGALFTAALAMLAVIQNMDAAESARLGRFGAQLGRTFQSYDDLLDVLGSTTSTGKDTGRDADAGLARGMLAVRCLREAARHYERQRSDLDHMLRAHPSWAGELRSFIGRVLPRRAPGLV